MDGLPEIASIVWYIAMERMEMARLDSSLNKNAPFSAYNKFS